ncbi:hypothetical protein O6H91_06G056900 [Diphasiastrum complanatum]|uniref:Uncharacterized protein n=1 Tax=Diphasiastrum complanatum TaxID=34168 RepID=A0ACC2DDS9_DIPCM|nr:hypothetical protein O6H91_06G056900 [Diphasiastrum complanatum]
MMMDVDGLSVTCAGLGCIVEDIDRPFTGRYLKGEDCLENLKDLQRFLRRDHPKSREVFFQLGRWNTVGRNLVPIICNYQEDRNLVLNAVKVVVFLTMPVDPMSDNISQQIEYLHHFKAAFLENDAVAGTVALLEEALEHLEIGSLTEDDWKMVQLVITLFRNLLAVSTPILPSMASTNPQWSYMRDAFLECLFQESVIDLLLALQQYVAGSHGIAQKENCLLLEILYHIFWGLRPDVLARIEADSKLAKNHGGKIGTSLQAMLEEEKEERKRLRLKDLPRHSRFSGTFVQIDKDGSRKIFTRNPFLSPFDNMSKRHQIKRGPVKPVAQDLASDTMPSKENVLKLLKLLADQFLATGYNILMQTVKEDIRKERTGLQAVDVVMFFKVAQFFTCYQCCRVSKSQEPRQFPCSEILTEDKADVLFDGQMCGPISSTMDEDMFMLVLMKWNEYSESAKETNDWFALATAGTLMKDMIRMLDIVLKARNCSSDAEQDVRVARILLFKVFYDQTESGVLHLIHQLIRTFDMHKQPRTQLADLVEMAHVVIRLLESLTEAEGALRVLKKRHKGNRRKDLKEQSSQHDALEHDTQDESLPDDLMIKLNKQGSSTNRVAEVQISNCSELQIAVGLESVEEAEGKKIEQDPENETYEFEDQLLLETNFEDGEELAELSKDQNKGKEKIVLDEVEVEEEDGETDDDSKTKETSLSMQQIVSKFANNTVVKNYCWLLKFFSSNTPALNYYIVRMLQRICSECALEPMLYQLSILQTFYEVLSDKKMEKSEEHKHMISFLKSIVRHMFKMLKLQPFLFVELLFWKTRQDCHAISATDMISNLGGVSRKVAPKRGNSIADALGDDEVDVPHNEDQDLCEKNSVLGKNTTAESLGGAERKESSRKKKKGPFTEEEEILIKELFEQFKDTRSCTRLIAQTLDAEGKYSTSQVGRKLKQLGLHRATKKPSSTLLEGLNSEEEQADGDFSETFDADEAQTKSDSNQDTLDEEEDDQPLGMLFLRCKEKKIASAKPSDKNGVADANQCSIRKNIMQIKRKKRSEASSIEDLEVNNESLGTSLKGSSNEEGREELETSSFQSSKSLPRLHKRLVQILERHTSMGLETSADTEDLMLPSPGMSGLERTLTDNDSWKNTFEETLLLEDNVKVDSSALLRHIRSGEDRFYKLPKTSRRKGFVIDEDD